MHRLEGIVWALEQKVTLQHYELSRLRAAAKAQEAQLQLTLRGNARRVAEGNVLRVALHEAEDWATALITQLSEKEAFAQEQAARIAALEAKVAALKSVKGKNGKDWGGTLCRMIPNAMNIHRGGHVVREHLMDWKMGRGAVPCGRARASLQGH